MCSVVCVSLLYVLSLFACLVYLSWLLFVFIGRNPDCPNPMLTFVGGRSNNHIDKLPFNMSKPHREREGPTFLDPGLIAYYSNA